MHSTDGRVPPEGFVVRWKKIKGEFARLDSLKRGCEEWVMVRKGAWLLWANGVISDLPYLRRKEHLSPVSIDWEVVKTVREKKRRSSAETKALTEVVDFVEALRIVEEENATLLECLLHAAVLFWRFHGSQANPSTTDIYEHLASVWDVMPPPVDRLPRSRKERLSLCRRLVREDDLCPSWFFHGRRAPERRAPKASEPASVGGLLDGI